MSTDTDHRNLQRYNDPKVVDQYEKAKGLQPCEAIIFGRWLKPGTTILDIGVGGGRTSPYLSQIAARYVGIDYSQGMVDACKRRFPDLDFRYGDATKLEDFGDGEFDVVVFSFNGIDNIPTLEGREQAMREAARVLKPSGVFIVSTHNARSMAVWPQLSAARGAQIPWRIVYAVYASIRLAGRVLPREAFWRGCGYVQDPVHGGLATYTATPRHMTPQLEAAGFEVVQIVGGRVPDSTLSIFTPWHYYACKRAGAA